MKKSMVCFAIDIGALCACALIFLLALTPPWFSRRLLQEPNLREEWGNALILVVLYMIQGVPLGLSMGSM